MRTRMMAWLILPALLLQLSCSDTAQENAENEVDTATTAVENTIDNLQEEIQDYRDEEFVERVYKDNKEELLLLNLAAIKGGSSVKEAAKKMQGDHQKLDKALADFAVKNNITLKMDELHDNLETQEAGKDWDNEWLRKVENIHQKLENKFERKEQNANNADLKAMVSATLPVLRNHLAMVESMNEAK